MLFLLKVVFVQVIFLSRTHATKSALFLLAETFDPKYYFNYSYIVPYLQESRTILTYIDSENSTLISNSFLADTFSDKLLHPVVVYTCTEQRINWTDKIDANVIFLSNLSGDHLDDIIDQLQVFAALDCNTKTFVYLKEEVELEAIESILRTFWKHRILNVVIIFNSNQLKVYTFNPFKYIFLEDVSNYANVFYDKLMNMNGSKLDVVIFNNSVRSQPNLDFTKITGVDGYMAEFISEKLNATFIYKQPQDNETYGLMYNERKLTGPLKDIYEGRSDLGFNSRPLNIYTLDYAETTYPHDRDDLKVLVPKGELIKPHSNLMMPYRKLTWVVVFFSLVIFSLTWYLLEQYAIFNESFVSKTLNNIFLDSYKSFLNKSVTQLPCVTSFRILLAGWVIYSYFIAECYQCKLISCLVVPKWVNDMETLEELDDSGLKIIGQESTLIEMARYLPNSLQASLTSKMIPLPREKIVEIITANNFEYAYVMKSHMANYVARKRSHVIHGRPVYHRLKESPAPSLVTYITSLKSPYIGRINFLITRIRESGFYVYWNTNQQFKIPITKISPMKEAMSNKEAVLTLSHLSPAFVLYLSGMFISLIAFIIEFIVYDKSLHFTFLN